MTSKIPLGKDMHTLEGRNHLHLDNRQVRVLIIRSTDLPLGKLVPRFCLVRVAMFIAAAAVQSRMLKVQFRAVVRIRVVSGYYPPFLMLSSS